MHKGELYTGPTTQVLKKLHLLIADTTKLAQADEIKGEVAYKGKARGRVRIITSYKQITKFKNHLNLMSLYI